MSSALLRKRLLVLNQRAGDLLEELLQIQPLLRGTFSQVQTRCGKANCWCAHNPKGHPHTRLTWSENGRITTRKVPPEAIERVVELTRNYRQFRTLRRKLQLLHAQLDARFDHYEEKLIGQGQRSLHSLGLTLQMSSRHARGRRKTTPDNRSEP